MKSKNNSKQVLKQKIPLSTNAKSESNALKNNMFNNFSDFKRNKPLLNFCSQNKNKTEKSEINLNSTLVQNHRKKDILILETTSNSNQSKENIVLNNLIHPQKKGIFYLIERIFKYLKLRINQSLYVNRN